MMPSDSRAPRSVRSLQFVSEPASASSWVSAVRDLLQSGHRTITARLFDDSAGEIASALAAEFGESFQVSEGNGRTPTEAMPESSQCFDATLLIGGDAERISAALLDYLDVPALTLVAPVTDRYYGNLPLYLISIPKAGTHLLFRLAEALGYAAGGVAPDQPKGGHWYHLLHSNAHTTTREFFRDELQRAPFGNRAHPFMRSPALFNYRNPFDILVSEANYWHVDGNSPLSVLLGHLSFEQRIARLIEDRWLLGSIRDRVGEFAAWLDCGNIVPVSFEEIVGDAGGGSDAAFDALVWSLQLKLHVPGRSEDIRSAASGRSSPTFREGRINGWRQVLSGEVVRKIEAMPQDFMEKFGYDSSSVLPRHAEAFRQRPLKLMSTTHFSVPYLIETGFLDHNIVSFKQHCYGVPFSAGAVDIRQLSAEELSKFVNAENVSSVRARIVVREVERQIAPIVGNLVKSELQKLCDSDLDGTRGDEIKDRIEPLVESLVSSVLNKRFMEAEEARESASAAEPNALEQASEANAPPSPPASRGDERVGQVHSLGSFLRYNLFQRRDGVIAVPMRIGPVDPNSYNLKFHPGVIASPGVISIRTSILRDWIRWAYGRARI